MSVPVQPLTCQHGATQHRQLCLRRNCWALLLPLSLPRQAARPRERRLGLTLRALCIQTLRTIQTLSTVARATSSGQAKGVGSTLATHLRSRICVSTLVVESRQKEQTRLTHEECTMQLAQKWDTMKFLRNKQCFIAEAPILVKKQ